MPEVTPDELTADLLALIRDRPLVDSGEHPIWRWQRWIKEDPERAWPVFERLVRQAPDEPDVLESVSYNLQLLLSQRWDAFCARAVALVRSSPLLDVVVGPEILTREHYGPRYRDLDELATVWVRQNRHPDASRRVADIMRKDPSLGLALALEIIERAPLHGCDADDLEYPLLQLMRHQGPAVVDGIENAARESSAVRRVIWDSRRLNPSFGTPAAIPVDLWDRLMRASSDTTLYNTAPPQGTRRSLGPELTSCWTGGSYRRRVSGPGAKSTIWFTTTRGRGGWRSRPWFGMRRTTRSCGVSEREHWKISSDSIQPNSSSRSKRWPTRTSGFALRWAVSGCD